MRRICGLLFFAISLVAIAVYIDAAEPNRDWVERLPANEWLEIDEKMSGNRLGAKVHWLPVEKKLVVEGGLFPISERESKKPQQMIYDPATGRWDEYLNEPKLPDELPKMLIIDPAKRLKLTVELPTDRGDLAGERVAENSPIAGESKAYLLNNDLAPLIGAVSFFDPVNEEVHLVGGSAPGVAGGQIGNWVFSLKKNAWRPAEGGPPAVTELCTALIEIVVAERDAVAAARNLFYARLGNDAEAKVAKQVIAARQSTVRDTLATLAPRVSALTKAVQFDASSIQAAADLTAQASRQANAALEAFSAGKLDAVAIAAAEDAAWRLDEAATALASSPPPRRYASGVFDAQRKAFYLFGGDHGDYTLGDLWVYQCADKRWRQIWVADGPAPRYSAQLFLLPRENKLVVFAGRMHLSKMQYQRFAESATPDVWFFDLAESGWQLAVNPGPETKKLSRDSLPVFLVNNPAVVTDDNVLICPAVGGNDYDDFMISSTWMARLDANHIPARSPDAERPATKTRRYRSQRAEAYDPLWYDAAARGDSAAIDKLLATMPPNQWVEMPIAPRPCPERSWGTSVYDPTHDQIFVWSGGHCADPADIVHHFHPGINRWSIGYVAGGGVLGNQMTGRPDCNNHTYHNFTWDPVSQKMVATQRAGTHVYDPERREWTGYCAEQPFVYDIYAAKVVGTKHGVVAWVGGNNGDSEFTRFFGLFDVAANKWTPLFVKSGTVPPDVHGDEGGITWDSKRDVLYLNAGKAYDRADGRVHKYDFATGEMTVLDPLHRPTIGDKFHQYRETLYLPGPDLVLFGMKFIDNRQVAYDPANNRWLLLNIPRESQRAEYDAAKDQWSFAPPKLNDAVGSITFSPVLDTKRNVLWAPSDYKAMFVMKLDAEKLVPSDQPD